MRSHLLPSIATSLAFVVAASSTATGLAQAATVEVVRFVDPFVFDQLHPCTGEPVEISGFTRVTFRTVTDSTGGVHFSYQLVPFQIRGEGESGQYKAVGGEREHINENSSDGLPITDTFASVFNLISAGNGDNFLVHVTFHITFNANGEITAVVINDRAECRG
jgi:hypothetical protein